jgi:Tfp pilus assembly protein PilP
MGMTTRRRRGSLLALAVLASLATALGCNEETPGAVKTSDFAAAREAVSKGAKRAAAAPAPVVPVAPIAKVDPISGVAQIDTGYVYDGSGKRDPFRSIVWDHPDKMAGIADAGPLGQFDLSQLQVVAVVWRTGNARALVQDPSGESYIVGQGAAIGKNRGHVISIGDNNVVVKETYVDYLGQETTKDVEMKMRQEVETKMRRSQGG